MASQHFGNRAATIGCTYYFNLLFSPIANGFIYEKQRGY